MKNSAEALEALLTGGASATSELEVEDTGELSLEEDDAIEIDASDVPASKAAKTPPAAKKSESAPVPAKAAKAPEASAPAAKSPAPASSGGMAVAQQIKLMNDGISKLMKITVNTSDQCKQAGASDAGAYFLKLGKMLEAELAKIAGLLKESEQQDQYRRQIEEAQKKLRESEQKLRESEQKLKSMTAGSSFQIG